MSTDEENAQAAAEGYWPVEGYESHGIDAHVLKTWVKEFIAKHSALAESLPAIPQEFLADEIARKAGSPTASEESAPTGPEEIKAPSAFAKAKQRLRNEVYTSVPIESTNPAKIAETPAFWQVGREMVTPLPAPKTPEDVSPFGPDYAGRKRN